MTEGHEDDFLVRVRAQVMSRDESTEGWLPLSGGGLANVSIRKRARLPPDVGGHEYIIFGQRISDQHVILSCAINRDLQYFKVMPTFHHWRAGIHRNGLTFQTAADARAFDKGIIRAYDDLIDDISQKNMCLNMSLNKYGNIVGEDDVFMTLDLPLEPTESRSNSEGSGSHKSGENKHSIHYISCDKPPPAQSLTSTTTPTVITNQDQYTAIAPGDNYSYVQLTSVKEYNYPVTDEPVSSIINSSTLNRVSTASRRDSTCSLKKRMALDVPSAAITAATTASFMKEGSLFTKRLRCRYCQEFYTEEWNRKGACEYAPDCYRTCLEGISGMNYARCMLYHCMRDSEGDTPAHPCECTNENGCTKRWIGLALLSLLVPCLWCYPPLKACHWVGITCGICGGKHKPQV